MRNLIAFVFISLVIHLPFSFAQVHPTIHIRTMKSDFQGRCDSLVITCESGNKLVPRVLSINGRSLPLMKADNTEGLTPGTGDSPEFTAQKQDTGYITVQAEGLTCDIDPVIIVPAPLDYVEIHLTPEPSTPASSLELISGSSASLYCFAFDSLHNYKENYQFGNINWHCEPSGIGEFNPQASNPTNFTALEAVSDQIWVSADGETDYLENVLVTPNYGNIDSLAIQYEVIP